MNTNKVLNYPSIQMVPQIHVSRIPGIEPNFEQKGAPYTMYVGIYFTF